MPAVTLARRTTTALAALLALDLLVIVVSGSTSILIPGARVSAMGFALRAAALAVLLTLRLRILPKKEERVSVARFLLVLMLLPTLLQFQVFGGRLSGVDAISYYVFLRSMIKDRDFDLANEYAHYGMLTRRDLAVTTKTGLRRSIYSVGPAVVWTPFFLLGEGIARAQGALTGKQPDLSGYGPHHRNAVALGNVLYGMGALLLIHAFLRRHFSEGTSLGAVLLIWGTTFFHWYLVWQPSYAHSASTLFAAYALWLWGRGRERRGAWAFFFLGVILGIAMCIRWQNGVLLTLPGLELLARLRKNLSSLQGVAGLGALLGAGTLLGAFPQMAAWKALYDMWVLPYPPQGTDFLRFDHPWILETLFSSRHGLFSWTPVFWAGYLGFLPLLRRRPGLALHLLPALLLMTYVNCCVGDWWGGASFSNRRFDSLLPILAFGFAASLDAARGLFRRRPQVVLGLVALPFAAWNVTLHDQVRRGLVATDDTLAFPRLVGGSAQILSDAVGFPTTWPASWIFAWRHGRPPGQYDLLVGRYLFYRQNSLGGRIDVGAPDDQVLLGDGWGPVETWEGATARCTRGRARLFAPLDVPEEIELRFRAIAPDVGGLVVVAVNGHEAGRFQPPGTWDWGRLKAGSGLWRRELNEVAIEAGGRKVCVDAVEFARASKAVKR